MEVKERILIILILISQLSSVVSSIKCFQCNSDYDQDCMNLNRTFSNKYMMDCSKRQSRKFGSLEASFCSKFHQKSEFLTLGLLFYRFGFILILFDLF